MNASDFGAVGAGSAAIITVLWAMLRDRRRDGSAGRVEDAAGATAAFAGFEGLVEDLRKDLLRLRTERDSAEARQVAREVSLNVEIERLRREVEGLRAQLAAVGAARPGRDGRDGVNGKNGTNGLNATKDRDPADHRATDDTDTEEGRHDLPPTLRATRST